MENFAPLAAQIKSQIDSSRKILIPLHNSPDPDSVCSSLALESYLTSIGKEVTVISSNSSPLNQSFAYLPGVTKILTEDIKKLNLSEYDLLIVPDMSTPLRITEFEPITIPASLFTIVIDHHEEKNKFGNINLTDPDSPATAQLLYQLFAEWGVSLNSEIALYLLVGIYSDTVGFKSWDINSLTFDIASKLIGLIPKSLYSQTAFLSEANFTPEQLRLLGVLISTVKYYFSTKVGICSFSYSDLQSNNIQSVSAQGVKSRTADFIVQTSGVIMGASLIEVSPNLVYASFRCETLGYDVGLIARQVGGGGHWFAAAANLHCGIADAIADILQAIQKTYPDLGQP